MKRLLALLFGLGLGSCSNIPTFHPVTVPPDLTEIRSLVASGLDELALEELEPFRWSQSGSIEAERIRQDLRLRQGELVTVLEELDAWQAEWPQHPDLSYLSTRIVEDPIVRRKQFHDLLRLYPTHPWIRFGAIATAQQLGDWYQAGRWLLIPLPPSLPLAYQHILQARQLAQQGETEAALLMLEADAFPHGMNSTLSEYLSLANQAGDIPRQTRGIAELALRQGQNGDLAPEEAIDLAFLRLVAEWPWCGKDDLRATLKRLDTWLESVHAPSGWAAHEEYAVAGVARLLKPESFSGPVAQEWADAGRVLLAGSAWGRGNEIHLLQDTQSFLLRWPGHKEAVEIIFANRVTSTSGRPAQGGTVFRGFYVLRDSVARGTKRLERRLQRFHPSNNPAVAKGRLESLGLAQRLRSRFLKDSDFSVAELELFHLCLHESGHFTEILNWLDFGLPVAKLLPSMLASRQRYGNPILWLEYRAQLRALSSGRIPYWVFAEILERGQNPGDPYFLPYRQILLDLLDLAEEQGWPPLSQWDTQSPEEFTQLAIDLCKKKKLAPMDPLGVRNLVSILVQADFLKQAPVDRIPTNQLDKD